MQRDFSNARAFVTFCLMKSASDETVSKLLSISAMTVDWIRSGVKDIPESRMCEQPGTVVNHPAWMLAHLGAYDGQLLKMLDDTSVPTADAELEQFGYGTTPVADHTAYPTKSELLSRLTERHARLMKVIAEKHADYFPRPAPEKFGGITPTIGHVAIIMLTSHLSYHHGQLKQWRRAAGLAADV